MKQLIIHVFLIGTLLPATLAWSGETTPEATQYARVLTIEPVEWNQPAPVYRDECRLRTQTFVPEHDPGHYAPTVIGAVAGGLIGSQVGERKRRPLTTLLGGVIGATVGHLAGEKQRRDTMPPRDSGYGCQPPPDYAASQSMEYDVTYYFDGQKFTATLPYVPDNWLRVWPDGTLVDNRDI